MSINPGRGQILGQTPETGNPLVLLARVLDDQNAILSQIAQNTQPDDHTYALLPSGEDMWTTYCLACSKREQRLQFPCLDPLNTQPRPPGTFSLAPQPTPSS